MKSYIIALALMFGANSLAYACDGKHGDKGPRHKDKPAFFQNMTESEKAEFKAVREKLKNMSKEERQAFKSSVKDKWSKLSEAEKNDFISKHQQKIDSALEHKKERVIMKMYGAELLKEDNL